MRLLVLATTAALALALVAGAGASELIDRNARGARVVISDKGEAMVTYRSAGRVHHVLAWGAVDARQPTHGRPQVAFRKDYSGRRWASFSCVSASR